MSSEGTQELLKVWRKRSNGGKAYYKAGAGVIFIEAPTSIDELKSVANEINAPLVANMIEAGVTPNLSARKLGGMGYTIVLLVCSIRGHFI